MTGLGQIGRIGAIGQAGFGGVHAAAAAADLRFHRAQPETIRVKAEAKTAARSPSRSGTASDIWSQPLLRAAFVAQILGQGGAPMGSPSAAIAAAKAYGPAPIRAAVLIDSRA